MTNAELGVKIIDIKLAILKIMSKTMVECQGQYLDLKKNKEKMILQVGMSIQGNKPIDDFINTMVLKAVINDSTIATEDKLKVINLTPRTFNEISKSLDDVTKKNLEQIGVI